VTSLTPLVRRILILWAALWVVSFLFNLGDIYLDTELALTPAALFDGQLLAFLGVFTYAFLHNPMGIFHLLVNCLWFFYTGPEIERHCPGKRFLKLMGVSILVAAAFQILLAGLFGGRFLGPTIGGSGMVSTTVAALAALQPGLRINLIFITVRLLPLFLVLMGLDSLNLLATMAGKGSEINSEIHLAGAAVGWTWAGGWQKFPIFARWSEQRAQKRHDAHRQQGALEEQELDRILAKISREGIGSLSKKEREFLERRSKR
jgi:rhomboid family protein